MIPRINCKQHKKDASILCCQVCKWGQCTEWEIILLRTPGNSFLNNLLLKFLFFDFFNKTTSCGHLSDFTLRIVFLGSCSITSLLKVLEFSLYFSVFLPSPKSLIPALSWQWLNIYACQRQCIPSSDLSLSPQWILSLKSFRPHHFKC